MMAVRGEGRNLLAVLGTHVSSPLEIPDQRLWHKFQIVFSATTNNSQRPETLPTKMELRQG